MNHFDDLLQAIGEKLIDAGVKAIEAGVARADVRAGQLVAMGDLPGIYPSNISESETGFVATSDAVFLDGGFVVLAKSGGVS